MPNIVWIWLAALVIFLILELMTPTLIFGCFVVGSLVAGLYGYFSPESYYVQIGLFIAVSVILIPLTRTLAKKITKESPSKSNVDALIGKVGLVTKAIDPDLGGQVKIEGEVWGALADEAIGLNDKVTVTSVQGTRLLVQKKT
jgi:membrane protein implicated in regulation of membrane protease activity